jgi:chemotaxis protein MotA
VDIATLIGLVGITIVLVIQLLLGGSLQSYLHFPALIGTLGASIMVLFVNFSLPRVLRAFRVAKNSFTQPLEDTLGTLNTIVSYAEIARKQGMLALEDSSDTEEDPFLRKCLRLAVDGTDPKVLSRILQVDIEQVETRHQNGQEIFRALGTYAPAFGMIGTLIGLIQMLSNLEDPANIGSGMAVALLTTFYGALIANAFALPIAGKLKNRSRSEVNLKWMMVDGIQAIQSGDSPRVVEEKLKSYLTPGLREVMEAEKEARLEE